MSVQKRAEQINPKPNWLEESETPPIYREWQRGTTWLIAGIILLAFDVMFVMIFIPSDLRAGGDFWITICAIETLVALVLIVAGLLMKRHAALERAEQRR